MRDLLTVLAIVLIVVLTAALAAPYFIDWNGQRAFVEARLSRALGQKVTIGGAIDVKLLPTPYIVLDQTVIGSDDGPIRIGIHHLDLQLSVAPLLHGEFEVVDARLEEPTIRVRLEPNRTLPALPDAPAFQADVKFDRISVADGTLAIADPQSGHTFVFDNLNLDADAPSLAGPFKISGVEGAAGARTKFRVSTTTAQKGRARAHLAIDETKVHAGLDLDGTIALTSAAHETVRESFDGTIALFGHLDQAARAPIIWRLSGPLKADPGQATLSAGELHLGGDSGLTLTAAGVADLGASPALHLDLTAKQLDIDRLAGAPVDQVAPPPPRMPDLASLRRALAATTPPLPTMLDISIDTATWGGETLSDLAAHVGLDASGPQRLQIGGGGPGGTRFGADGTLTAGAIPSFSGAVDFAADNLPRAIGWLAAIDPDITLSAADLPFKAVKLTGKVKVDAGAIDATGLALTLGRSVLSGTARLGLTGERDKLTADLEAKALDLDALPDLAAFRGEAEAFDLDLKLAANAIKVSRAGDGAIDAGRLDLALTKTGRHVAVTTFRAQNLGGAAVTATGSLDPDSAALKATIDAAHLDAFANLVRQVAPGEWADAFVSRAPVLAPAKLAIEATLAGGAGGHPGALRPSRVRIGGSLGATVVDVRIEPAGARGDATSYGGSLQAPEGSALLSQLGLPVLPLNLMGPSSITLGAIGTADQPLDTTIHATFGATQAILTGQFRLFDQPRQGSGRLELKSNDFAPLLQSLAVAFPDMTGTIAGDLTTRLTLDGTSASLDDLKGHVGAVGVSGSLRYQPATAEKPTLIGRLSLDRLALANLFGLALGPPQGAAAGMTWSNSRFGTGLLDPPRASLALKIAALDLAPSLVATNAALDLGVAPNVVTLRHATAALDGGALTSDVTLRRDGPSGALEGRIALDKVAVDLPGLRTAVTGTLDLAGSGQSALALVASLAGTGTATFTGATVPTADPTALPKVFDEVENDDLAVDQETVARALEAKAGGTLDLGTRRYGLVLAGGTLQVQEEEGAPAKGATVTSVFGASLDLRQTHLKETIRETLRALPKNWSGPPPSVVFALDGPPTAPKRSVDVSAFLDAVATRALARETARIEAYEFDVRERAFFNQRLFSERRREQDRLKAEADARKAEAERKAKLEAARLEKIRKEEAAKAAAQQAMQEKAAQEQAAKDQAVQEQAAQDRAKRARATERSRAAQPETTPEPDGFPPTSTGADPNATGRQ